MDKTSFEIRKFKLANSKYLEHDHTHQPKKILKICLYEARVNISLHTFWSGSLKEINMLVQKLS